MFMQYAYLLLLSSVIGCGIKQLKEDVNSLKEKTDDTATYGIYNSDSLDTSDWYAEYPDGYYEDQVVISEVYTNAIPSDDQYTNYDWVEIYNYSDETYNLFGWHLKYYHDNALPDRNDALFNIPLEGELHPGEYKVIMIEPGISDSPLYNEGTLYLFNEYGHSETSFEIDYLDIDISDNSGVSLIHVYDDAFGECSFGEPTPGSLNQVKGCDDSLQSDFWSSSCSFVLGYCAEHNSVHY